MYGAPAKRADVTHLEALAHPMLWLALLSLLWVTLFMSLGGACDSVFERRPVSGLSFGL